MSDNDMSSHDLHSPGVEPEGVSLQAIFGSIAISAVLVVILVAIGVTLSAQKFQEVKLEMTEATGYPVLRESNMEGAAKLSGYSKGMDGSYTIPIERAMELEAQESNQ